MVSLREQLPRTYAARGRSEAACRGYWSDGLRGDRTPPWCPEGMSPNAKRVLHEARD